tara:strand:- start:72 stop:560 length:489 start_codon:yes stop_codon:yes gene_type:complete
MRRIDKIILHCTATARDVDVATVRRWHMDKPPKGRGWRDVGYHFLIRTDGTIEHGRPIDQIGAHVKGQNKSSIGIAYAGGLDVDGTPRDTRTDEQTAAMVMLSMALMVAIPTIRTVHGHNEFANKACPCFDVTDEFWHINNEPWRDLGIHEALLTAEKTLAF